jgi:hypothetical protein
MPLYIPSIVLSVTGLLVLCFVRRGNRIGYLIKLCGICCLASAVLCVVVTVTTTVIHMNRLKHRTAEARQQIPQSFIRYPILLPLRTKQRTKSPVTLSTIDGM